MSLRNGLALWTTGWLLACNSSEPGPSCEAGTLRCACYRNQTCDNSLICLSNVCVAAPNAASAGATTVDGSAVVAGASTAGTIATGAAPTTSSRTVADSGATAAGGVTATQAGAASGGTVSSSTAAITNVNRSLTPAEVTVLEATACGIPRLEPTPTKFEIAVDISSSMNQGGKWDVTKAALLEAICGVKGSGMSAKTSVGIVFYPNKTITDDQISRTPTDIAACMDPSGIKPMAALGSNDPGTQRSLLRQSLTDQGIGRGTPTADAYAFALDSVLLAPAQKGIPGDPYMVLITDGAPTMYQGCYNPSGSMTDLMDAGDAVVRLIQDAWLQHGVRTFVMGLPSSESQRSWLSAAAAAGQTSTNGCSPTGAAGPYCHLDLTTATNLSTALSGAFAQIVSQTTSCTYDVPPSSAAGIDKLVPLIKFSTGANILLGRDPSIGTGCSDGYRVVGSTQLELCKNSCIQLHGDASASLEFVQGC